jgi:hypothetical protein
MVYIYHGDDDIVATATTQSALNWTPIKSGHWFRGTIYGSAEPLESAPLSRNFHEEVSFFDSALQSGQALVSRGDSTSLGREGSAVELDEYILSYWDSS